MADSGTCATVTVGDWRPHQVSTCTVEVSWLVPRTFNPVPLFQPVAMPQCSEDTGGAPGTYSEATLGGSETREQVTVTSRVTWGGIKAHRVTQLVGDGATGPLSAAGRVAHRKYC